MVHNEKARSDSSEKKNLSEEENDMEVVMVNKNMVDYIFYRFAPTVLCPTEAKWHF